MKVCADSVRLLHRADVLVCLEPVMRFRDSRFGRETVPPALTAASH